MPRVIMFTGKGGVGKTTISGAAALHFSSLGKKTLILTSDPAPSLGDLFQKEVGDKITEIKDNLFALELSEREILRRWEERFGEEIYQVISTLIPIKKDFIDYIGTAPGIDEEFMLYYIYELWKSGEYEVIIWDTAPAGHTLRLLKMPSIFLEHLEEASRVYLKIYSSLLKLRDTLGLSPGDKDIFHTISSWKELSNRLLNFLRENVEIYAVCKPEALSVYQTLRMKETLKEEKIVLRGCIVNGLIAEPDCKFHKNKAKKQEGYLRIIRKNFKKLEVIPEFEEEIVGIEAVQRVEKILFGNGILFQPL